MRERITIKEIANKALLVILLVSAFNLSFHVSEPKLLEKYCSSTSFIDEQEFTLLPFKQQETTASSLQVVSTGFLYLPEWQVIDKWVPLVKTVARHELFYKLNLNGFKEYPFIVLVRKLRI